MKIILIIFCCGILSIQAKAQTQIPVNAALRVSIVKLISQPELFDGKRVLIKGFLHARFEDNAIYYSENHGNYLMMADALWLRYDKKLIDSIDLKFYDNKYVLIVGTFKMNDFGHMGSFAGTIDNVTYIDALPKNEKRRKNKKQK